VWALWATPAAGRHNRSCSRDCGVWEYRGYDSAGLATVAGPHLHVPPAGRNASMRWPPSWPSTLLPVVRGFSHHSLGHPRRSDRGQRPPPFWAAMAR